MFIRYTVMIFGEKFTPTQIGGLQLENMRISDISDFSKEQHGCLCVSHIREFAAYIDEAYEDNIVSFIEWNYSRLIQAGADDFWVFMDVYYQDQCNFEIFNKHRLNRLSRFNVSLPISVYAVDDEDRFINQYSTNIKRTEG